MFLTYTIYLLIIFLLAVSVKVSIMNNSQKESATNRTLALQEQLQQELNTKKWIIQKLKLLEDLNMSLKQNIFKILNDMLILQKEFAKNNNALE